MSGPKRDPASMESEALRLWEDAQALRAQLEREQSERLRDFGMLLGIQQDLPKELRVEGGTNYYADEIARGLELDKVAVLRAAGHVLPDLHGKLAAVPEAVVLPRGIRHGFPTISDDQMPLGMRQCRSCGMIWSLLNFYPQKDRGLETLCRLCKHERGLRQRARTKGLPYECQSEYAAIRAVFPFEGPEERRELGIVVNPGPDRDVLPSRPSHGVPTQQVKPLRRKPIPKPAACHPLTTSASVRVVKSEIVSIGYIYIL